MKVKWAIISKELVPFCNSDLEYATMVSAILMVSRIVIPYTLLSPVLTKVFPKIQSSARLRDQIVKSFLHILFLFWGFWVLQMQPWYAAIIKEVNK